MLRFSGERPSSIVAKFLLEIQAYRVVWYRSAHAGFVSRRDSVGPALRFSGARCRCAGFLQRRWDCNHCPATGSMPSLALVFEFSRWIGWFSNGNFRRRVYFRHGTIGWFCHTLGDYRLLDFGGVDPRSRLIPIGKRWRYSVGANVVLEHVPAIGETVVA